MPPTAAGRHHHLALGDRVEDAASVFGPLHDDVELSSYAAFEQDGAGLDDALLDSVGLVAGDGLEPALRRTLAHRREGEDAPTILLGLPADLDGIEQVRALSETLDLSLRTELSGPDGVVLRVCPGEARGSWEVPAPEVAAPAATRPPPSGTTTSPAPAGAPAPVAAGPSAGGWGLRQLALVGALGLLVVVAVAVVLLVAVGTGAAVVLLLLAVLVAVGATAGLVLVVLRRLAALDRLLRERLPDEDLLREQARFRRQVRSRTERIEQLQRRSGQRARERAEAVTTELHTTQERVTALAALTARLGVAEPRGRTGPGRDGDHTDRHA